MTECKICMESFPSDVFQYLPCAHSLCKFCFTNLKKTECPYCKYSFSDEMTEEQEEYFLETLELPEEPISRRKRKRNRNRRKIQFMFESTRTDDSVTVTQRFEVLSVD